MYTISISIISTSERIQISSDIAGRMVSINCAANVVYFPHPKLCSVSGALAIFCFIFFLDKFIQCRRHSRTIIACFINRRILWKTWIMPLMWLSNIWTFLKCLTLKVSLQNRVLHGDLIIYLVIFVTTYINIY